MNDNLITEIFQCTKKLSTIQHPKFSEELSRLEAMVMMYAHKYKEEHNKESNVSLLCEMTCSSMQSLSRTLKNLEVKGYILRKTDPDNRRNTIVVITDTGEELIKKHHKIMIEFMGRVFDNFDDNEILQFIAFEKKLYKVMKKESEKTKNIEP